MSNRSVKRQTKAAMFNYFTKKCVATCKYLREIGLLGADAIERIWAVMVTTKPIAYGKRWPQLSAEMVRQFGPACDKRGATSRDRFHQAKFRRSCSS